MNLREFIVLFRKKHKIEANESITCFIKIIFQN